MSRIHKLESLYKERLKNYNVDNVSDFIQSIVNADITKGKYARFLIEAFLNDKFLEEDLIGGLNSTVGQTISLFDKHKGKLPVNERSVYALSQDTGEALYQSPGDLWKVVKQYQGEKSGKELKKEEQEKIYRETKILFEDNNGFKIISPLTKESAQWWGKGTRWCTSAENNNMFEQYNEDGPLIIIITPEGRKFQGWQKTLTDNCEPDVQFMDEDDNFINSMDLNENWHYIKPIAYFFASLSLFPTSELTLENKLFLCKKNGHNLKYLIMNNDKDVKNDFINAVIKEQQFLLNDIVEKEDIPITLDLISFSIKLHPSNALEFLDKDIELDGCHNLDNFILKELKQNYKITDYFLYIDKYLTQDICNKVVKENPELFKKIPNQYKTLEMIKENNKDLIEFLPISLWDKEAFLYICRNNIKPKNMSLYNKKYLHDKIEDIIDDELIQVLAHSSLETFKLIPKKYLTSELYLVLIQYNGNEMQNIPLENINIEIVEEAIKTGAECLPFIPDKFLSKHIYDMAVHYNALNMLYVPEEYRTQEMYNAYYNIQKHQFHKIPDKYKTEQLCQLACKDNIKNILDIPKKLKNKNFILSLENKQDAVLEFIKCVVPVDNDIILHFVKQNGLCLKYVNKEHITEEMARIAFANDQASILHFPDHLVNEETIINIIKMQLEKQSSYFLKLPKKYQTKEIFDNIKKGRHEYKIFRGSEFHDLLDLNEIFSIHDDIYKEIQNYINDEKQSLTYC